MKNSQGVNNNDNNNNNYYYYYKGTRLSMAMSVKMIYWESCNLSKFAHTTDFELETTSKGLLKRLDEFEILERLESIQITEIE